MSRRRLLQILGQPYDVIWTIGDSISRGNSDAVGTTPTPDTVYQWDAGNSNLREITNLDLLEPVAAGAIGSQWPAAGTTYYSFTRKKPVFVNTGIGGSAFFNPSAGFSWWTNDTVFSNALTKVNNCLAYMAQPAPKLVWINMGINDVVQGHALDQQYLTSLVDRILAEWPGVRICFTLPWSSTVTTYANLLRLLQLRKWIKALTWTYDEVEEAGDLAINTNFGSNFQPDLIHLNALGNGFYGDKTMYGICQSLSYSKWIRSYVGKLYSRISTARMDILQLFVNDLGSDYEFQDSLQFTSTAGYTDATNKHKNALADFASLPSNQILSTAAQFSHDGWSPAGLIDADRIASTPISLFADKSNLTTDAWMYIYITANAVGATTASTQHGVRESPAGALFRIRQTGASLIGIMAGSASETTNGTDTRPTADHLWGAGRDGGDQVGTKDAGEFVRAAVAATALNPGANVRSLSLGNINNNGTIQERWAGKVLLRGFARFSINHTTFNTAITNLIANGWFTNIT
jgi:hypothetical protein